MKEYIFRHNGEKINEEILMEYIDEDNIMYGVIGNIYNLVDYINYNVKDNSKLKFINFTGNKLKFIIGAISRCRSITGISEYYSIKIGSKKRIRGR